MTNLHLAPRNGSKTSFSPIVGRGCTSPMVNGRRSAPRRNWTAAIVTATCAVVVIGAAAMSFIA